MQLYTKHSHAQKITLQSWRSGSFLARYSSGQGLSSVEDGYESLWLEIQNDINEKLFVELHKDRPIAR